MNLRLYRGDILDVEADILICSANVSLNLSGGVGGSLLLKYGPELQKELHSRLPPAPPRFAEPGDVVVTRPGPVPYKAVLHAVAVDVFYDSSPQLIAQVCRNAFRLCALEAAESVALTALAMGYGHLSMSQFAEGLREALSEDYPPLKVLTIGVQPDNRFDELRRLLPEWDVVG